jgi:hypothetical protein
MNKRVRAIGFLAFILAISSHAAAQDLPVVAVYTLSSSDVGDHIAKTVNDLVFSFVRELRTYRVMDMRSESLPRDLGAPDGTDYIFFGTMTDQPDGIKLELVLKGGPLGVTRLLSRVYENSNRILLESRMLVRDLFDQSVQLPEPSIRMADAAPASAPQGLQPENLKPVGNIDSLAGSWKGEDGIERIMILRGGRGVAVLSSGVSIPLEIITSGRIWWCGKRAPQTRGSLPTFPTPWQNRRLPSRLRSNGVSSSPTINRRCPGRRKTCG